MAAPIPTMTVTFDIPVLAQLLQANHDLRREVSDLRTELSARVQAVETHLASQRTDNSTLTVPSQDLDHNASAGHQDRQHEDLHIDQDLHDEINGNPHQDVHVQQGVHPQQDGHAQQDDHLGQDDSSQNTSRSSSPSIDQGLTVMDAAPLPSVTGHKRKRIAKSTVGRSPYINHSGFVVRGSDTQLAQRKGEVVEPSRSESPFDPANDRPSSSSNQFETMPPVRPQSRPEHRPQRPRTVVDRASSDDHVLPKSEEVTLSQYGRVRRPAQPPPGFVGTPGYSDLAKMLRQQKKK